MKSGKQKKQKHSKQTRLTCPKCDMMFYAFSHYKIIWLPQRYVTLSIPTTANFANILVLTPIV